MDVKDEGMIKMQDFQTWFGNSLPDTMIASPTEPHDGQTTADTDDEATHMWNDPPSIDFGHIEPHDSANGGFPAESHSTQQFAAEPMPVAPQPVPSPHPRPPSASAHQNMQLYSPMPVSNGNSQPQLNTAIQPTYYSNGSSYPPPVNHYPQSTPSQPNGPASYPGSYMAYGSGMSPTSQVWQDNGGMVYASNGQPSQMSHPTSEAPIDNMLRANGTSPPPPAQTTNPIYGHTAYAASPPVSSTPQPQIQHTSYAYNWTPEQLRAMQQMTSVSPAPQPQPQQPAYRARVVPASQPQHPRVQQAQRASPMPTMSPRMMHMPAGSPVSYPSPYGDIFNSGVGSPYSHQQASPASINPQALSQPSPSPSLVAPKPLVNTIHLYKQYMQPHMMDGSPVQTAKTLIDVLTAEETPETDPETRLWLLTRIRDGAGKDFFKTWANDPEGMMLVKEWLRAATSSKDGKTEPGGNAAEWQETIMPLLQVIDRLPLGINQLRKSKIGSYILKLSKNPPNGAIRDLASSLENRYRQLMEAVQSTTDDGKVASGKRTEAEARGVKRKSDTPPLKTTAPAKRTTPPSTAAVAAARLLAAKKEKEKEKAGGPVTKETKSDSSFFTDTKPKPAPVKRVLPSFTKKSTTPAADVAQPSSRNTFEEALAHMGVKPKSSTPTVPEPMEGVTQTVSKEPPKNPSKKRKRVTFRPEEHLVEIRWIEKAIYDGDDDATGAHHNVRDLDRDEGAAMHKQLVFEELIDWTEPMPLLLLDLPLPARGLEGEEAKIQEEREKTALLAHYPSGEIPPSPAELPLSHPTNDDALTKTMLAGEDIDSLSEKPVSVAELLAKMGGQPAPPPTMTSAEPVQQFGSLKELGIDPSTFTQMLQQHNIAPVLAPPEPAPAPAPAPAQPHHGSGPEWGGNGARGDDDRYGPPSHYDDYGPRSRYEDRGRGGRGRGRGRGGRPDNDRGQKLCYFYPLGKCKYGDQCHNLHVG